MSKPLKKCLLDTNVPKTANLAIDPATIPDELTGCVLACVQAVEHVVKRGGLVIDAGDEIFDEYRRHLDIRGQPGVGDRFMKWVHDNRWTFPAADRVAITRDGDSYREFPDHEGLSNFDPSDRKFVAVANVHSRKPPILEATDSKWWGWRRPLAEVGIAVKFLCPDYAKTKYEEKMGT
jgi:hypothetical protein